MVVTTKQPSLIGLWSMKESQIMREERGIEEKESRDLRWRTERKKKKKKKRKQAM
jgi:hypothetical protein